MVDSPFAFICLLMSFSQTLIHNKLLQSTLSVWNNFVFCAFFSCQRMDLVGGALTIKVTQFTLLSWMDSTLQSPLLHHDHYKHTLRVQDKPMPITFTCHPLLHTKQSSFLCHHRHYMYLFSVHFMSVFQAITSFFNYVYIRYILLQLPNLHFSKYQLCTTDAY